MSSFKNFLFEQTLKKLKQKAQGLIHLGKDTYEDKSGNHLIWDDSKQNFIIKKSETKIKEIPNNQTFSIPYKLKNNFKIEGDLSNVANWRAKIFENNNNDGESKKGDFQDIGYIMISLDSNTVIPIARNDEHHKGYDLVDEYISKNLISKENYISIFTKGHDYVYSDNDEDTKERVKAYKKWRSYGGSNFQLEDPNKKYLGTVDDFLKVDGKVKTEKGKLSPIGEEFVGKLEKISTILKAFNENPNNARLYSKNLFKTTRKFLNDFDSNSSSGYGYNFYLSLGKEEIKKFKEQLDKAEIEDDWKKVEQIFLSHNGIKNVIHMELRKFLKKPNDYSADYYKRFFGDLEKAYNEFNRLGDI